MREYIACIDNDGVIRRLPSMERGERFERQCPAPAKDKVLSRLVPAPMGYKARIPLPRSRDEMVPDIAFGSRTRTVLDVSCGVASVGAYLLSCDVLTLSIAPKDVHENQIQFSLERGVPAMVATFATHRLLYPSQAFEIIHCSRCRINWRCDDGILLLEVNRMLRAGGYFASARQPVYKHEQAQQEARKGMVCVSSTPEHRTRGSVGHGVHPLGSEDMNKVSGGKQQLTVQLCHRQSGSRRDVSTIQAKNVAIDREIHPPGVCPLHQKALSAGVAVM